MPNPRKLPKSGNWQARFPAPDRHRETYATKREAEAALEKARGDRDNHSYVAPKNIPTFGAVADEWLATKLLPGAYRENTIAHYRGQRPHLAPLNQYRLSGISVTTIERLRDELYKAGELSISTVNSVMRTCTAIFKFAMRRGYTQQNPAALAERLRIGSGELVGDDDADHSGSVDPREVLDPAEIRRLIKAAKLGYDVTLVTTVALTGMRIDEALALRWGDVEIDAGNLHVRRSLSWAAGTPARAVFTLPKTKSGLRTIPFPAELSHALKLWKLQCPKGEADLIFPNPEGQPIHRTNLLRSALYPACRRAGLRQVGFHSLRHSYASILIMNGASITETQHLLGHGDPSMTLRRYVHWLKGVKTDSADKLGRTIFGSSRPAGHLVDTYNAETTKTA